MTIYEEMIQALEKRVAALEAKVGITTNQPTRNPVTQGKSQSVSVSDHKS